MPINVATKLLAKAKPESAYPEIRCLRNVAPSGEVLVLFVEKNAGVVFRAGSAMNHMRVGTYYNCLAEDLYIPYDGEVTISNRS